MRALVTGASRGIGAAIARELASRDYHVIINYRSSTDAAEKVREDIEADGGQATLAQFDVSDRASATEGIEALLEDDEPIGVLVNNAGITRDGLLATMSEENWDDVMDTTLDGFYHVTKPLVWPMIQRRWGRIINISSMSGVAGTRGQVNYSAAKAGLNGATRALAREIAKRGVTVNAVAPGLIETDMIEDAPIDRIMPMIPMQRLGQVEEVSKLVGFLASEESSYITGQVIGVNGGLS